MCGDVNLYLNDAEDQCCAEIEVIRGAYERLAFMLHVIVPM